MATQIEIPAIIKKNVRSVLLSKKGGVLVSDFLKDYKSLIGKTLQYRDLGFSSIKDFISALSDADVARLEYCDAQMAHKVFGIGEPNMYMSLSAKRAQGNVNTPEKPVQAPSTNGDNDVDNKDLLLDLIPNSRGVYSLCYPRHAEPKGITEEEVMQKFSEFGDVADINMIPGLIFVRFQEKSVAAAALRKYGDELELRVAEEKKNKKMTDVPTNDRGLLMQKRYKAPPVMDKNKMEVYVGNISQHLKEGEFREIIAEFSPLNFRMVTAKSDARKVCAFVDFSLDNVDRAEALIQQLNQKEVKGRKLNVRFATPDGGIKKTDNPTREGKSMNGSSSSITSQPKFFHRPVRQETNAIIQEDEDAWDADKEETPPTISTGGLTSKMSTLTVNTKHMSLPQVNGVKMSPLQSPLSHHSTHQPQTSPQISPQIYTNSLYNGPFATKMSPVIDNAGDNRKQIYKKSPAKNIQSNGYASPPNGTKHLNNGMFPQMPVQNKTRKDEDIPHLEPIEVMPHLELIDRPVILFVGNFVYGATEDDLAMVFGPYNVVDVEIQNTYDKRRSSQALVTVGNMELARQAMADLDQHYVNSRRLLVCIAKQDPLYETPEVFSKSKGFSECAVSPKGGSSLKSSSTSSLETTQSGPVFKKSFNSVMKTFQIILSKFGVRRRDTFSRPNDSLTVFITSVYDDQHFWGQVIQNESDLSSLEEILTGLQHPDSRIGPTKGLGRCAALHETDWFRGWITAEKSRFQVEVFFVDYGNTATLPKKDTSLTVPDVWEVNPMVRPFRLAEGKSLPLSKDMESKIAILRVVKSSVDDTGFLTEVTVTSMP